LADQTVTAIAYRWGFTSSSRFAASYRRTYGITPSQTLRYD
jgi:AraC-like DNA-binding protein